MEKRILMIIPPQRYREEELDIPKEYFESHGFEVIIASTKKGECDSMFGKKVDANLSMKEVDVKDYAAIVFVGGGGTPIVRSEEESTKIASEGVAAGKVMGAICWAPTILAKAGVLNGKKATVWHGQDAEYGTTTDEVLEKFGAAVGSEGLVVDGNIVTADGPANARGFAEAIVKLLKNDR